MGNLANYSTTDSSSVATTVCIRTSSGQFDSSSSSFYPLLTSSSICPLFHHSYNFLPRLLHTATESTTIGSSISKPSDHESDNRQRVSSRGVIPQAKIKSIKMTLVIVFGKWRRILYYAREMNRYSCFTFLCFFFSSLSFSAFSSLLSPSSWRVSFPSSYPFIRFPFVPTTVHFHLPLHLHLFPSLPLAFLCCSLTHSVTSSFLLISHPCFFFFLLFFHFSLCSVLEPVLCLGPPSSVRIHSADPANHCNLYFHTESRSTQLSSQSTDLLTLHSKYS